MRGPPGVLGEGRVEGPCCGLKGVSLRPWSRGARLEQVLFRRGVWVLVAQQGRSSRQASPWVCLGWAWLLSYSFQSRDVFTGSQAALGEHILPTERFLPILIKPDLLK